MGYVKDDSEGSGPGAILRVSCSLIGTGRRRLQLNLGFGCIVRVSARLRFRVMMRHELC